MFREGVLATNRNMQLKIQVLRDLTITSLKILNFSWGYFHASFKEWVRGQLLWWAYVDCLPDDAVYLIGCGDDID
jgi:hypothetical protein